ncbi:hypothetical protein R6Z07M_006628 [Ovis aries]
MYNSNFLYRNLPLRLCLLFLCQAVLLSWGLTAGARRHGLAPTQDRAEPTVVLGWVAPPAPLVPLVEIGRGRGCGGGTEVRAEPGRGRGGVSSCGAAGPVRPKTSPTPLAPPSRVGHSRRLASVGERWSPLARDTVGSAGGVRTQVPARAELAALTGPAGPGPGPGRAEGPARPPGPAADQAPGTMGLGP